MIIAGVPGFMSNNPLLGFLVASSFAFFLTSCDVFNKTTEQYLSASQAYFRKGEYTASLIEIKNAIQQDSTNPQLRQFSAQVYLKLGKVIEAEAALNKAVVLGADKNLITPLHAQLLHQQRQYKQLLDLKIPETLADNDQSSVLVYKGFAAAELNELEVAKAFYQQSIHLNAQNLLAQRGFVMLYVSQGLLDQALRLINQLIEQYPLDSELMSLQGDVYVSNQQFNAALASYANAAALPQSNYDLNIAKHALVCVRKNDIECARKDLSELEKKASGYFMTAYVRGLLAIKQQRWKDALVSMTDALAMNPELTPAYYFSGLSSFQQQHYGSAINHLSRFVSRQSDSVNGRHLLSLSQLQEGHLESAKITLQPIIKSGITDPSIDVLLGQIEYSLGNIPESVAHFKHRVELQPESAIAHAQLGMKLLASGDKSSGLNELGIALELAPDLLQAGQVSVMEYLGSGQFDKAQVLINKMRIAKPGSTEILNLQALLHMHKGEPKQAKKFFSQALKKTPGDPTASLNFASLLLNQGDVEKTIQLYQTILKYHPHHIQTHLKLAEFDLKFGNDIKAEQRLLDLIAKQTDALEPRLMLAQYYLVSGRVDALTEILEPVSQLYPKDQRLLKLSAEGSLASGLSGQAKLAARALVDLAPDSANAHWLLARVAFAENNKILGKAQLKNTLRLEPDYIPAQIVRIKILAENKQEKQAIAELQRLNQQAPGDARVISVAGWMAMHAADFNQSVGLYRQAFSISATSANVLDLAKAQWQAGQQENAISTIEDWTIKHPEDVKAQFYLAMNFQQMGLDRDATARFSRVLQFEPDNVVALNNLAWLLRNENSIKALQSIEKAIELEPDNVQLLDTLGMVLLQKGDITKALRVFQRIAKAHPDYAVMQYHLALALHKNNELKQAIDILNQLIAEFPEFKEKEQAQMLLAKLKLSLSISG